jgi:gas vesicle protein GvpL/GvpF
MSLYVYALATRVARRWTIRGLAGERLKTIRVGPVGVVVGEMTRRPKPTSTNLVRYDRIMTQLWKESSALLPARFGTIVTDLSELNFTVAARRDAFRRRLAIVRNRAQMTVLVAGAGAVRPRLHPRSITSGTEYLRAARAALQVPHFGPVRVAVRRWVKAERVQRHGSLATVHHLIPRRSVERYRAVVEGAARDAGIRVRVLGPRSPYAFADE